MDTVQAKLIAEKFAMGTCSEAEHEALFKWMLGLPVAESRLLIEEYGRIFENLQAGPARKDLWEKILQRLDEPNSAMPEQRPAALRSVRPAIPQRAWMFAAASALVLIVAGIFLFLNKKPAPAVVQHIRQDVAPGGYKATLTLADGTVIILDSAQEGQLARQGNTRVIKLNTGLLAYKASPGPSAAADDSAVTYNTITTPKGGQYQLSLPDGSKVWLNSASSLRFPTAFNGNSRMVNLTGEGYFEIAKNVHAPFTVAVNKMSVRVLGTGFNIMAYEDESSVNTTVLQGAVEVSEGELVRQLAPGQQAMLNSSAHTLAVKLADVQQVTAWKNGLFEFDHTDLAAIMRQLARWYDIDVHYQVAPNQAKLGGSISRSQNLSDVLNLMETNGINHFAIDGKKVNVLP